MHPQGKSTSQWAYHWLDMRQLLVPAIVFGMVFTPCALAQQAPPQNPAALGDVARKQREQKFGPADDSKNAQSTQTTKSLAEIAREQQARKRLEVKITEKDSKELFGAIEEILTFASGDSGLPRHAAVGYRLLAQEDLTRFLSDALSQHEAAQRLAQSELVLKKFGYLPREFAFKKSLMDLHTKDTLAFYDPRAKTMNLMNWVDLEHQSPIMAHELTHALQDQNYNLLKWQKDRTAQAPAKMSVAVSDSEENSARSAVLEGQAMIVFYDYLLKPHGRTLANTPDAVDFIEGTVAASYDTSVVIHDAPLVMKDTLMFPYREGLAFELALLKKGGPELAFAGALTRPPWDTHEILEPEAYLSRQKRPFVALPDLSDLLAGKYQAYDSGTLGQLDVRILSQQYGTENDMFTVTSGWQGGSFVVVKSTSSVKDGPATTADLALLYVSQWKTWESAERFAEVYKKSLSKRYTMKDEQFSDHQSCAVGSAPCGVVWTLHAGTEEGPVTVEIWPGNLVIIAQSFDDETTGKLRDAVLHYVPDGKVKQSARDLSLRLYELPAFRALQQRVQSELLESFSRFQVK